MIKIHLRQPLPVYPYGLRLLEKEYPETSFEMETIISEIYKILV